jgi:hypothetical protein
MATAIVKGALLAGKLGTKKALKLLKDHGHKAKVSRKGDKIKVAYEEGRKGKFKTKVETLPKEPTLKRVRDFLGYKHGGRVVGIAKRGFGRALKKGE